MILVLAIVAGLAVVWVEWGGSVRRWVAEWMTIGLDRRREAAAAYEAQTGSERSI